MYQRLCGRLVLVRLVRNSGSSSSLPDARSIESRISRICVRSRIRRVSAINSRYWAVEPLVVPLAFGFRRWPFSVVPAGRRCAVRTSRVHLCIYTVFSGVLVAGIQGDSHIASLK
jgi:hypothetical protein